MDGVPEISFAGIAPGETFTYRFKVGQSGTYWYHSHSAFQEITGMYGAIVVEPAGAGCGTAQHQTEPVLCPGLQRRRRASCYGRPVSLPGHSRLTDVCRRGNEPVVDFGDQQRLAAAPDFHLI
jgi:hypothetical protein